MEAFLDIASLYFFVRRRGGVVLAITIFNFIFWGVGMWSTMKLHFYGLMAHAVYSMSVVGGFYIFILVDAVIADEREIEMANQDDGQMSRVAVRIISSLPHLGIFLMGIYSLVLLLRLEDELEARKRFDRERLAQLRPP